MDDLSLPFRRATAKVVKVVSAASAASAASNAATVANVATTGKSSSMILIVLIVVGVVAYFFFVSRTKSVETAVEAPEAALAPVRAPITPPLVLAKTAKEKCIKTADAAQKCELHQIAIQHFLEALAEASAKGTSGNVEAGEICMQLAGMEDCSVKEFSMFCNSARFPVVPNLPHRLVFDVSFVITA